MLAFFVGALSFFAALFWLIVRHFNQKNEEWLAFGRENGLGDGFGREPLRGKFSSLTGLRGDFAVRIKAEATQQGRSSDPNHLQLDLRVIWPDLPAGIAIYRETALTKLGKIFHTQDIEIGDATFDAAFKVKGKDAEFVKRWLMDGGRFMTLSAGLAGPLETAVLDEQGLKLHCDARLDRPDELRLALARLDRPDELRLALARLDALAALAAGLR